MKDLINNFVVQAFTIGLTNEHIQYALIDGDISTMHKLVACAYIFAKVDEMIDHHSARAR